MYHGALQTLSQCGVVWRIGRSHPVWGRGALYSLDTRVITVIREENES